MYKKRYELCMQLTCVAEYAVERVSLLLTDKIIHLHKYCVCFFWFGLVLVVHLFLAHNIKKVSHNSHSRKLLISCFILIANGNCFNFDFNLLPIKKIFFSFLLLVYFVINQLTFILVLTEQKTFFFFGLGV